MTLGLADSADNLSSMAIFLGWGLRRAHKREAPLSHRSIEIAEITPNRLKTV